MNVLGLTSCIPYALGQPRILGVKGISTEDFPKNCLGGTSNISLRMRTMTVSESYPTIRLGG